MDTHFSQIVAVTRNGTDANDSAVFVTCSNEAVMLDFVDEPLDQIALLVEILIRWSSGMA